MGEQKAYERKGRWFSGWLGVGMMLAVVTSLSVGFVYVSVGGLPSSLHWTTDWLWRPVFVKACISGAGNDSDRVLRLCLDGYKRFRALDERIDAILLEEKAHGK